ncbi:MAG: hypothetical protein JWM32_446 [Verrucomicrobia bacterium]|nr:hypothetical protein [Verrucomicrobiota bacterium]
MKRVLFFSPYVALTACHVASHWMDDGHVVGNIWAVAFVACFLCVPILSRKKLWLGYVALFYPIILIGLHVAFDWGPLSIGT